MPKKYYPSGHQIIVIDTSNVDDGNLLETTEDEKLLYKLFASGKHLQKPILLKDDDTGMMGIAVASASAISLVSTIASADSVTEKIITLAYDSTTEKIGVTVKEVTTADSAKKGK